jgi:hypothetical protein
MRTIALLLLAASAGCGPRALPEPPESTPAPPPAGVTVQRPPPRPVDGDQPIRICVLRNGVLRVVPARYDSRTGDTTTLEGLPFSSTWLMVGEYASVAEWYVNREPIRFRGQRYRMHGTPRVIGMNELVRAGEFLGVPVFVAADETGVDTPAIYLPFRPGCEFQPYVPDRR